ncbi:hypothetical protein ACLKA6_000586 [Drosophila palustris]
MENYLKRVELTEEVETESAQKRKRERSVVWDHFKKSSDKAYGICNYCGKHLKTAGKPYLTAGQGLNLKLLINFCS